jgi:hypothetical protein
MARRLTSLRRSLVPRGLTRNCPIASRLTQSLRRSRECSLTQTRRTGRIGRHTRCSTGLPSKASPCCHKGQMRVPLQWGQKRIRGALLCFVLAVMASPFKSKSRLEAENMVLWHQLNVQRRKTQGRIWLTNSDRWFFVQLYRWFPSIQLVLTVVRPETLVPWHRAGFRRYLPWKSRSRGGRPQFELDLRALIRRMSVQKPALGSTAHPPRTAQARVSGRAIDRRLIHGQEWARAVANLEDFPL